MVIQRGILFISFVFIFLLFYRPIETEDVWWHLSTGRWIVEHQQVPHQDPFPFANEKTPWLCYHWLGSTILYLVAKVGGLLGLKIFRALFFVGVMAVFYFYARRHVPFYFLIILMLLMSFGLAFRFFLKADMFNFIFVQMFLIRLFEYQQTSERSKLVVLPLLGIIWFNIHIGAFIYGGMLFLIFMFSAAVKFIENKFQSQGTYKSQSASRQFKELLLTFLVFLGGFLLNPYGWEGFWYPFKTFFINAFLTLGDVNTLINDFLPGGFVFTYPHYFYFHLLVLLGLLALVFNKKDNLTLGLLFLVALFSFICVRRNAVFFVIVAGYVIVQGARYLDFKNMWDRWAWSKIFNVVLATGLIVFLVVWINNICHRKVLIDHRVKSYHSVIVDFDDDYFRDLVGSSITGPVLNKDLLGGEILWSAYPSLKPFLDGRNLNLSRFADSIYMDAHPQAWPLAEKLFRFKVVILHMGNPNSFELALFIHSQPTWQLISVKGAYAVFIKREEFLHLPKKYANFEQDSKSVGYSHKDIDTLKALAQRPLPSMWQEISNPSVDNQELFFSASVLRDLGYKGAALKNLIEAFQFSSNDRMQLLAGFLIKELDN